MRYLRRIFICLFTVFLSLLPIRADAAEFIRDDSGVLGSEDISSLTAIAQQITDDAGIAVYVRFSPDQGSASSIEEYAEQIWNEEDLGYGSEKEGIMLVIDTGARQYDILAHGDTANRTFTDYGKQELADAMMPYLRDTDYASAASVFVQSIPDYIEAEEEGQPIDTWIPDSQPVDPVKAAETARKVKTGVTLIVPPVIALIICLVLRSKNHAKGIRQEADDYLEQRGLKLTGAQDILLYTTRHVTHVERNSGGGGGHMGGTSVNSGGFSHSSGSF